MDPPPRPVLADRVLVTLCVLWGVTMLGAILTFAWGHDQAMYAYVARRILEGGVPYRDVWDFKPPGIYLPYLLADLLYGRGDWPIRAIEVLGLLGTAGAMVVLARRWFGEPKIGVLGAFVYLTVYAQGDFWYTAQSESFGGMITVFALLAGTSSRRRFLFAAGVLFGLAGLFKPQLGTGLFVVATSIWLTHRREKSAGTVPALIALAIGAVVPIAACLVWLGAHHALGPFLETMGPYAGANAALSWQGRQPLEMLYRPFFEATLGYSSLITLGLLCLFGFRVEATERRGVLVLVAVATLELLGVSVQGKFYLSHYGATWPLIGLLAGLGLWKLWSRVHARPLFATTAGLVIAASVIAHPIPLRELRGTFFERTSARLELLATGFTNQALHDRLATSGPFDPALIRDAGLALGEIVPKNRTIFVWGIEPSLYTVADRHAPTRYFYDFLQRVTWAPAARAELMSDLLAAPPAVIVVVHHDVIPEMTGDLEDSAQVFEEFPALRDFVNQRYAVFERFGHLDLWIEKR